MYLCGSWSLQPDRTQEMWAQSWKRNPGEALKSTDGQIMVPVANDMLEFDPTDAPPNGMLEHRILGRRPVTRDGVADEPWWVGHTD